MSILVSMYLHYSANIESTDRFAKDTFVQHYLSLCGMIEYKQYGSGCENILI
jgi:hypothetical protein